MMLQLFLIGLTAVIELMLWVPLIWRIRQVWAIVSIAAVSIASGFILGKGFGVWSVLILLISVYRVINLLRLIEGRTKPDYLYKVSLKSSLYLLTLQLGLIGIEAISHALKAKTMFWLGFYLLAEAVVLTYLSYSLLRHMSKLMPKVVEEKIPRGNLPTLSVLIPARNETEDLERCLSSLLANDYPKLEVLVLDDCSQNKRTPEIIKQFAHDGVEFVEGGVPPDDWLAKNYAYEQLVDKANGELLLFCGVDVRFAAGSIELLVQQLLDRKKTMISLLPDNYDTEAGLRSVLLQPIRYAWEVVLPRRIMNRPAVLSTCWLIKSKYLSEAGGFKAVKRSVAPEANLAKLSIIKDGYSFIRSAGILGLSSQKSTTEKQDTAIRTRYPQLHRRPELVMLLTFIELVLFVLPFGLLIVSVVAAKWNGLAADLIVILGLLSLYLEILKVSYVKPKPYYLLYLGLMSPLDLYIIHKSMWQYEFHEVLWKGRNICLPLSYGYNQQSKNEV